MRSGINVNIVKVYVCPIHNIYRPKLWLYYEEVAHGNVANIPEYKRHWTARQCVPYLCGVPSDVLEGRQLAPLKSLLRLTKRRHYHLYRRFRIHLCEYHLLLG